jgi:dGTPase
MSKNKNLKAKSRYFCEARMTIFETAPQAPYAINPNQSRGRRYNEAESKTRTPFERDRDRVIHSSSFRRLKGKTQVFVAHEGDHFRTRLTHSLEVSQIARSVARRLKLNEDLAEACALSHDLGHPPFGHTGEEILDEAMKNWGGFDHNAQTIRVITRMEQIYPNFDGLNLTWETLEGTVKHNGPLIKSMDDYETLAPVWRDFNEGFDLMLTTFASLEAQVAAVADDIAYNNHDLDDALVGGIFTIDEVCHAVPWVGEVFESVRNDYPKIDIHRLRAEAIRRLIGAWVNDLVDETNRRLEITKPQSADDVRNCGVPLVGFSPKMLEDAALLRKFLFAKMYRFWKVNRARSQARRIIKELFEVFLNEPETLPPLWQSVDFRNIPRLSRHVCDYIAGMTDDFAIDEHRRLFNLDRFL